MGKSRQNILIKLIHFKNNAMYTYFYFDSKPIFKNINKIKYINKTII